jgi:hypothetical protein
LIREHLPFRHEHLECGNGTREDRQALPRHNMLYHVRDLLVKS